MMSYDDMIQALLPVARSAGERIMDFYSKPAQAERKEDGSPVTDADEAAELIVVGALRLLFPQIPIISEENPENHHLPAPQRFFLVDPLDGTKEFIKRDGKGAFTVNIALIESGVPVMGIIYAPALDRMFSGALGIGAHEHDGDGANPIHARKIVMENRVAVASVSHRDAKTNLWLEAEAIETTISIGSSLKFCLVASGEADVYPRFGPTMEWDTAAGDAILRAAGGNICIPDGTALPYGKPDYLNGPFIALGAL